jgi:hypothetical protein
MAPYDFWLFLRLKTPLQDSHFDSHKDIVWNVMKELRSLPEMLPAVAGRLG